MAALLRLHVRQRGGDAVEHPLDVDVYHAVPVVDLQPFERRERHQAGVVDDHVDAPVRLHGAVDEALDLGALGHVGPHDRVASQRQLVGQRLKPVEAPRAQHQLRPVLRQPARGGFSEPAARPGDDDDFILDAFAHEFRLRFP